MEKNQVLAHDALHGLLSAVNHDVFCNLTAAQ